MKYIHIALLAGSLAAAAPAFAGEHSTGVSFQTPHDGATVGERFKVSMSVHGMRTHKAGEPVEGTGHFHIIVDGDCVKQGEPVTKDATHIHFGKGQHETELHLTPGAHSLSLQFADGRHISYGRAWCDTIHVTVQ
jgi:hypothetical protein